MLTAPCNHKLEVGKAEILDGFLQIIHQESCNLENYLLLLLTPSFHLYNIRYYV